MMFSNLAFPGNIGEYGKPVRIPVSFQRKLMKKIMSLCLLLLFTSRLQAEESWFAPEKAPDEPLNLYWRPIASLLLPGFDQYLQGHVTSGLAYSSAWVSASVWYANRSRKLRDTQDAMNWKSWSREQQDDYLYHEELPRQASLASQYITSVGALSAWQSFRTGVETHRESGRFSFLREEETPLDLLAAPFQFSYLQRKTTWIPLLVATGLGALIPNALTEDYQRDPYSGSDALYASAISYNAGVSEEALFRGYMQPLLYDGLNSSLGANSIQALIFALAHRATIERPIAQAGMGFYLGWLQEKRNWTLGESIFVHAWWDVLALSSSYLFRLKEEKRGPPPVIWLPAFSVLL
jgi:membrane protease YdiL (CAAX protease family)